MYRVLPSTTSKAATFPLSRCFRVCFSFKFSTTAVSKSLRISWVSVLCRRALVSSWNTYSAVNIENTGRIHRIHSSCHKILCRTCCASSDTYSGPKVSSVQYRINSSLRSPLNIRSKADKSLSVSLSAYHLRHMVICHGSSSQRRRQFSLALK